MEAVGASDEASHGQEVAHAGIQALLALEVACGPKTDRRRTPATDPALSQEIPLWGAERIRDTLRLLEYDKEYTIPCINTILQYMDRFRPEDDGEKRRSPSHDELGRWAVTWANGLCGPATAIVGGTLRRQDKPLNMRSNPEYIPCKESNHVQSPSGARGESALPAPIDPCYRRDQF